MVLITHKWYKPMLDVRQAAAPETETTVVCRPAGGWRQGIWVAALLWPVAAACLLSGSFFVTGSVQPLIYQVILFGFFGVPLSVCSILYLAKARIIADAWGLRWRELGHWRK